MAISRTYVKAALSNNEFHDWNCFIHDEITQSNISSCYFLYLTSWLSQACCTYISVCATPTVSICILYFDNFWKNAQYGVINDFVKAQILKPSGYDKNTNQRCVIVYPVLLTKLFSALVSPIFLRNRFPEEWKMVRF